MKRLLLFVAVATLHAQDATPEKLLTVEDRKSPSRNIIVEQYWKIPGRDPLDREIWLVSTADETKRHLLFRHQRTAEVVFSPDETWLAINNGVGSGYSAILLYHQKAALEYEQVADLTEAAWKFFNQRNGFKATPFDHAYANVACWTSADPPILLIRLSGHISGPTGILKGSRGWFCLYDIRSKKFSTDLDALNKQNTRSEPK